MNTDRIDLEAKVAFLERTVEALSEALHQQGSLLDAMERRVARLEKRAEARSDPDVGPHDSPPPHY
ncbi:MAG: SlyX family protein [Planctomycetota bacterium]